MSFIKINKPHIKQPLDKIETLSDAAQYLEDSYETEITAKHFKGLTLSALDLSEFTFEQVIFENCRFIGCSFHKASFTDVLFNSCDLSNANLSNSYMSRCAFEEVKAVGANFLESFFRNVSIEKSIFKYATLHGVKADTLNIVASDFDESFFSDCKLKAAAFDEVSLMRTEFFRTPLKGIDLSSCNIEQLLVSSEKTELKGVIVNTAQAVEFAKLLGIRVV